MFPLDLDLESHPVTVEDQQSASLGLAIYHNLNHVVRSMIETSTTKLNFAEAYVNSVMGINRIESSDDPEPLLECNYDILQVLMDTDKIRPDTYPGIMISFIGVHTDLMIKHMAFLLQNLPAEPIQWSPFLRSVFRQVSVTMLKFVLENNDIFKLTNEMVTEFYSFENMKDGCKFGGRRFGDFMSLLFSIFQPDCESIKTFLKEAVCSTGKVAFLILTVLMKKYQWTTEMDAIQFRDHVLMTMPLRSIQLILSVCRPDDTLKLSSIASPDLLAVLETNNVSYVLVSDEDYFSLAGYESEEIVAMPGQTD